MAMPTDENLIYIEGHEVLSLWHENCQTCTWYLSRSVTEENEFIAKKIHEWYGYTLMYLRSCHRLAFYEKDIDYPEYFPGRHWLSHLEKFWMQLFPQSDTATYHQVCSDVLTVLNHHLFFSDGLSSKIEQLQLYLIDNYESVHNALSSIAENFKKYVAISSDTCIFKKKEIPEEDGSWVYYRMGIPYCICFGGQQETEQQKRWSKFAVLVGHFPNPADQSNEISSEMTAGVNETWDSSDIER